MKLFFVIGIITGFFLEGLPQAVEAIEIQKIRLPNSINSSYIESRPLISGDGNTLFFCRRDHPENIGKKGDPQDIWYCNKDFSEEWGIPVNLGEPLNNRRGNAVVTINQEGNEGIFVNTYGSPEKGDGKILAKSYLVNSIWAEPIPIKVQNYSNKSTYADFCYSYEEEVLLMAIQKSSKNNVGDQDIYVSFPTADGTWGSLVNLGTTINTKKAEYSPFLGSDGKSLFFVSEGHPGEGGADIFFSRRLDETWINWSEPENIGVPINSSNDEVYFSITADFGVIYFESYKKRSSNRDIFKARLPEKYKPVSINTSNVNPDDTSELTARKKHESESSSKLPSHNTNLSNSPKNMLGSENLSNTQINSALETTSKRILNSFPSINISEGDKITQFNFVNNIYFEGDKWEIQEKYFPFLDKIHEIMQSDKKLKLKVIGHSDATGSTVNNLQLSKRRANQIAIYLKEKSNMKDERLILQGYGENFPLATNDDELEGRELNRRVELQLIYLKVGD